MVQRRDGSTVKLGLVQMRCAEETERNLETALAAIGEAAKGGAKIVCLPELFRSRYFCQAEEHAFFDLAEPIPGPSSEALCAAARRHEVVVVGSLFERFRRGPTRVEGARRGLGIGLSVVRGLVDAMSGQVTADRSPLGGLAVSVRLRPAPAEPER